jgi:glycosyltransferase involved in cell wall biosynthesis
MATRKTLLSVQPVSDLGGSDQALLRMCRQLSAAGWECHVVFPKPSPMGRDFAAAGAACHVVPMRRLTTSAGVGHWLLYALSWPASVLRLLVLALKLRPAVLHSNSLHSWYAWAVALLLRKPHIWHAREIVVQSKWALFVERYLTAHFARKVVAVSRAVAGQFSSRNVVVVHDGLTKEDGFSPENAGKWRKLAGIGDEVLLVGAAGRLDVWKGFEVALAALPLLREARPGAKLLIAGGPVGGKEAYAECLATLARRTEGAHLVGRRDDIALFMADLDAFALPSTEPEPFGLVAIEALASGVPVVVTEGGGAPEVLEGCPPAMGRVVPPGDPAALAAALSELLPATTSAEKRRARRGHLGGDQNALVGVFEEALEEAHPLSMARPVA